jgi:hypothetical protein
MIGAVQHVGTVVDRQVGVIGVLNPLDGDRELRLGSDPAQVLP